MEGHVLTKKERGEIRQLIKPEEVIVREIALSWDGINIMIRLPKDIANYFKINEKNRFEKMMVLKIKKYGKKIEKTFDIIERKKQIRKYEKRKTNKK